MIYRSIHFSESNTISFCVMTEYIDKFAFLIHSSGDECLDQIHILATVNCVGGKMDIKISLYMVTLIPLDIYQGGV